jgi:hypothetical protein
MYTSFAKTKVLAKQSSFDSSRMVGGGLYVDLIDWLW